MIGVDIVCVNIGWNCKLFPTVIYGQRSLKAITLEELPCMGQVGVRGRSGSWPVFPFPCMSWGRHGKRSGESLSFWVHVSTPGHTFIEPGELPKTPACTLNRFALGHGSANEFHKKYHGDWHCCPRCWGSGVQVFLQGVAAWLHAGEWAERTQARPWEVHYQGCGAVFLKMGKTSQSQGTDHGCISARGNPWVQWGCSCVCAEGKLPWSFLKHFTSLFVAGLHQGWAPGFLSYPCSVESLNRHQIPQVEKFVLFSLKEWFLPHVLLLTYRSV